MNKIIFTNDRLFMALVGPGGSGKTRLIYSMLALPAAFYPPIGKTFFTRNINRFSKNCLKD